MNKVQLFGRLGRDPEIRNISSGKAFCNLSMATSERYKDRAGEWKEQVEWHRIVIWAEPLVNLMKKHGFKGQRLFVEGKLQTRKWQDQDGKDRYSTEVILQPFSGTIEIVDWPARDNSQDDDEGPPPVDDFDDQIPF